MNLAAACRFRVSGVVPLELRERFRPCPVNRRHDLRAACRLGHAVARRSGSSGRAAGRRRSRLVRSGGTQRLLAERPGVEVAGSCAVNPIPLMALAPLRQRRRQLRSSARDHALHGSQPWEVEDPPKLARDVLSCPRSMPSAPNTHASTPHPPHSTELPTTLPAPRSRAASTALSTKPPPRSTRPARRARRTPSEQDAAASGTRSLNRTIAARGTPGLPPAMPRRRSAAVEPEPTAAPWLLTGGRGPRRADRGAPRGADRAHCNGLQTRNGHHGAGARYVRASEARPAGHVFVIRRIQGCAMTLDPLRDDPVKHAHDEQRRRSIRRRCAKGARGSLGGVTVASAERAAEGKAIWRKNGRGGQESGVRV